MRAHEAGALHADSDTRGPAWLRQPVDPNALVATCGRPRPTRPTACSASGEWR